MSFWRAILACTLLSACSADPTFLRTNSMIDPNRLFWWKTKWAPAPIQLGINNVSKTSTVTFFINPTTSITNGVFEVTFPSGFTLGSGTNQSVSSSVVQLSGQTYIAGVDYAVQITSVTNPSTAGGYGPLALRTRYSTTGQQVDVNLTFGSVYISPQSGTLGGTFTGSTSLTVALAGTSINNVINKSGNTLSFQFTIAVSLWRFDTFIIKLDPNWIIASGATCSSATFSGRVNNFNGTNSANPHSLDCVITPPGTSGGQTAYIYGLAVDGIDLVTTSDNAYVDLRVTSVTTPNAVYGSSAYSWTVSTSRFGTATILETGTYTAGPTVTNDIITSATWTPTWGLPASSLIQSTSYFMDLTFTITNAIPAAGSIIITVTEDLLTGDGNWVTTTSGWIASGSVNCYIKTYLADNVVCTVTANTITLTALPSLTAGTSITVRNIVKISTGSALTAMISFIKTYQTTSIPIDVGSSLASFTVAANANAIVSVKFGIQFQKNTDPLTTDPFTFTQAASYAGGFGDSTQAFQLWVVPNPATDLTSNSVFTINCPLASTIDDFAIGVPSSSFSLISVPALAATTTNLCSGAVIVAGAAQGPCSNPINMSSPTAITTNTPVLTVASSSASLGSIIFTGATGTQGATGSQVDLLVYQPSGTSNFITLPRVANNLATAYECNISIATNTKNTQRGAVRFVVSPQTWSTKTFSVPCTSVQIGMPGIFKFIPSVLPVQTSTAGTTYYVEVSLVGTVTAITPNFSSGVTSPALTAPNFETVIKNSSVPYPHDKSLSATTSAYNYYAGSVNYVAVTGFPLLSPTATTTTILYIPLGGIVNTSVVTPTLRSFYILQADPRYKFITHESTTNTNTFTAAVGAGAGGSTVIGTTGSLVNGSINTSGLTLNLYGDSALAAEHYIYITLGTGYTWTSVKSIQNIAAASSPSYSTVAYFSSLNTAFAFPGVLVDTFIGGVNINAGATNAAGTVTITGFALPLGAGASTCTAVISSDTLSSACRQVTTFSFTSAQGSITNLAITPNSIKTRGSDGVNVKHVVSFTLQHGIPKGGSINLTFGSDWLKTGCSVCSVNVLTPVSPATTVLCTFDTTSSVAISGFTDFSASSLVALQITITALLPPPQVTGTSPKNFVTILTTSTGTAIIDSVTDFSGSAVTVIASSASGSTIWLTKKTYPMTAGTTSASLYLKFSFPHNLPTCGVISLTPPMSFLNTGTVTNSCFLSPLQYSSCAMSGGSLLITLNQDYIAGTIMELYLDNAVNNPTTAVATTGGFAITTYWGLSTVIVDQDPTGTGVQSTQQFTAAAALPSTSTITPITTTTGLTFVPRTTGEAATYTFDFKDAVAYTVGDQYWIVFPPQFDYFLGDVWTWFTNEPSAYYIGCSSAQLGITWCTVNHNIVVVRGATAVTVGTETVISINNVVNPVALIATGKFSIYHVDSNGNYLTINQSYGTVTPTAYPLNIDVRSLVQSDNRIFRTSDYTWRIYLYETMNIDSQLQVLFPREFDLNTFDQKASYTCATSYLDDSTTATVTTQQSWNSATSCSVAGNMISLAPPTSSINFTAGLRYIITWTVQGVTNTQWAQPRYAQSSITDFDIQDNTLWPISPFWASKFTFFVYRTSSTFLYYTSRSYPNMNSAYAGFYQSYRPLYVNSYTPQTKSNRIVVFAGTQSQDVWIQTAGPTFPMAAKQILFTPSTNAKTPDAGKLKYTSVIDNWVLFQSFWQIRFRVAAAADLVKGLYYISWQNTETKQTGLTDVQYDTPVSTLVEVVGLVVGQYAFSIGTIPSVAIGYTTVPILVSLTNSPHSDVTVTLSVSGSIANVSVSPKTLTFSPDVNNLYFQVSVASNYDITLGTAQTIMFALSGTNANSYAITPTVTIMITSKTSLTSTGNIVTFGLGTATKTTQTVSPTTSQIGVIYYQLSAVGTPVPSFSALKAAVGSLVSNSTNTTNSSPTATQSANTQSDPGTGETWFDFQVRLYKNHLQQIWTGAISMTATTAVTTLTFNWLYAGTNYQIAGYLDNLGTFNDTPTQRIEYFTSAPIADCQPFSIKFQGLVPQINNLTVTQTAANVQGVNPLRLANYTYKTSTSRILQTISGTTLAYTSFNYILLPNRFSETPDPSAQAQITGAKLINFTASLLAQGINNTLNGVTNGAVPTRVTPIWTQAPDSGKSTNSSVTVTFLSNTNGKVCCIALNDTIKAPNSDQILRGMDGTNTNVTNVCIWTDLTKNLNSITVPGLIAHTTYYLYCTATDNYPLWPTQMAFSTASPNVPATITTLPNTMSLTGGRQLGGIICLLLALLLN